MSRLLVEGYDDGFGIASIIFADPPLELTRYFSTPQIQILENALQCLLITSVPPQRIRPFYYFLAALPILQRRKNLPECAAYWSGIAALGQARPAPATDINRPEAGGDRWLASIATRLGIPWGGLESRTEAFSALAKIPDTIFLKLGQVMLDESPSQPQAQRLFRLLSDAQNAIALENLDRALELTIEAFAPHQADRAYIFRHMFEERNILMASRIAAIARSEPAIFAVGGLHVAGEMGVHRLLQRDGFQVEPVRLPAYAGSIRP